MTQKEELEENQKLMHNLKHLCQRLGGETRKKGAKGQGGRKQKPTKALVPMQSGIKPKKLCMRAALLQAQKTGPTPNAGKRDAVKKKNMALKAAQEKQDAEQVCKLSAC